MSNISSTAPLLPSSVTLTVVGYKGANLIRKHLGEKLPPVTKHFVPAVLAGVTFSGWVSTWLGEEVGEGPVTDRALQPGETPPTSSPCSCAGLSLLLSMLMVST